MEAHQRPARLHHPDARWRRRPLTPPSQALPLLIADPCARTAMTIVPVSELVGKHTRTGHAAAELSTSAGRPRVDSIAFFFLTHSSISSSSTSSIIGDVLMSATPYHHRALRHHRPVAQAQRLRDGRLSALGSPYSFPPITKRPSSSARSARCMMSNYKNIRIIVIDDGSSDNTYNASRRSLCQTTSLRRPPDSSHQAERR